MLQGKFFVERLCIFERKFISCLITLRFDRCTAGLQQVMVSSGCVSFSRLTRNHSKSCYENELKDHLFQKNCQINKHDRETKQQKEIVGT